MRAELEKALLARSEDSMRGEDEITLWGSEDDGGWRVRLVGLPR